MKTLASEVSARWVPKKITVEHKHKCLEIYKPSLYCYNNDGEEVLSRIVTGDKTWVHHYSPESRRQSMKWKHFGSPVKKKFKTQLSAGKVMLTIFWDSKRPILENYLKREVQSTTQDIVLC